MAGFLQNGHEVTSQRPQKEADGEIQRRRGA